jgi:hypothetical protein
VGDTLVSALNDLVRSSQIDEFIFVSDNCAVCRSRAGSYVRYIHSKPNAALFVEVSTRMPLFESLINTRQQVKARTHLLPVADFRRITGVRTVPSYIQLGEDGRISKADVSNIGWLWSILDVRHWIRSRGRLL